MDTTVTITDGPPLLFAPPPVCEPNTSATTPIAENFSPAGHNIRDRRRERPMLSCTFCRTRKVRCDRQLPCSTCTSKGISLTCTYMASKPRRTRIGVGDRIQELETLVRTLMEQQRGQPQTTSGAGGGCPDAPVPSTQAQARCADATAAAAATATAANTHVPARPPSFLLTTSSSAPHYHASPNAGNNASASPEPPSPALSDQASMRPQAHGGNYVGSGHWAAILDSIAELRDHYEEELEAEAQQAASGGPDMTVSDQEMQLPAPVLPPSPPPTTTAAPRLLYEPVSATRAEILASIPDRRSVDRLVASYFHAQNAAPIPVLHSGQFLREYEAFWQDPESTSYLWLALLFGILALAMQFLKLMDDQVKTEGVSTNTPTAPVHIFRDRTVQCLVLGRYTRGGEHVLPALINYISLEMLLSKDADIGVWLVLGVTVQLALSMGYHRDASNFARSPRSSAGQPGRLSPFSAEMRRRIWVTILQMDLRLSSQMGFPRLCRLHQCDTAEPRNLLDADFDENCTELPPSRPETEITPVLYILAKNRIDGISSLIADLLADTRLNSSASSVGRQQQPDSSSQQQQQHHRTTPVSPGPSPTPSDPPSIPSASGAHLGAPPYSQIMALDRTLDEAAASLPPILRWQPLSQAFMLPPNIVMQRIPLHLAFCRMRIWLHRRYLAPAYASNPQYSYSRRVSVESAMEIVEFQRLVHDETAHPDGLLFPLRWMVVRSLQQFVWLLGMGTLCYYLQLVASQKENADQVSMGDATNAKIYTLLRNTYPLWLKSSEASREARLAVDHLSRVLGLPGWRESMGAAQAAGGPKMGGSGSSELSDNIATATNTDTTPMRTTVSAAHTASTIPTTTTTYATNNTPASSAAAPTLATPMDAPMPFGQVMWDAYQDCIINFPSTPGFSTNFLTASAPLPTDNIGLEDLMLENTTDMGDWMELPGRDVFFGTGVRAE